MDVVLLDEARDPVRIVSKVGIDRLGLLVRELEPDVIAIDAPPAWAPNGSSRLTERLLAQCNIHAFNTPSARDGSGHPFYAWMEFGFEVFAVVAARGYPRYRAGAPGGPALEVCRHGSAAVLAGCLPPRGAKKKPWRERILAAQGVRTAELTTADRVDAALCALTGLLALEGKRFAPGDPKEGVIVLPAASLPARPFRPAPAEAHDGTPTGAASEAAPAALEGGERCFAFASGMAAETTLLLTLRPGDHVLLADDVYGGTYRLLSKVLGPWGLSFDTCDMTDHRSV